MSRLVHRPFGDRMLHQPAHAGRSPMPALTEGAVPCSAKNRSTSAAGAPPRNSSAFRTSAAIASSAITRSATRPAAASTASASAASTSATTPATAPTSAPTPSAPASTSRPSSPPCATRRRRSSAAARPPSPTRKSICTTANKLRVGLHLPPRHSDQLHALAETFFDGQGLWKAGDHYQNLIEAVEKVPEQVTILSDAMEFMEREIERQEMAEREQRLARRSWSARSRRQCCATC